ncbi:hypothetical protein AA313_de0200926 [Arthrobotrys entomopaga]|nr:hypothetical protein AA313_de0200926 [Arthrobotrys entomopaga]
MIPTKDAAAQGKKGEAGPVVAPKEPFRMEDIGSPTVKGAMTRSMSMTIQAEKDDLKEAAKDTFNVVVDLNLDGNVRWVSSSWQDVIGTSCDSIQGKPISSILFENTDCFQRAVESMKHDDSKSYKIRFSVVVGPLSAFAQDPVRKSTAAAEKEGFRPDEVEETNNVLDMEGQGILVFDRGDGQASHTMWVIRPWTEPKEITIDLPATVIESLGVGAGMLAQLLNSLAEDDPENHPPPLPVLCRICESQIQPWWFEKHSELCMLEHKAESEVQLAQENLAVQRNAIVKVLDAMERASSSNRSAESSTVEYRGFSIKPPSAPPSGTSSPNINATARPKESTSSIKSKFGVRRPQVRIVELLLDLCDTALEISTPSVKESLGTGEIGEFRTQSPASEARIGQVLQWQSPSTNTLDQEHGLALLCSDTENCSKAKVEAVLRHRNTIEYSERIRYEYATIVQDIIDDARNKANALDDDMDMRSAEGDVSEGEDMSESQMSGSVYQMGLGLSKRVSIGSDLRRARRYSSPSSSPQECLTPRSQISMGREGGRRSRFSLHASAMSYELEGNESDASVKSSVKGDIARVDSPVSEHGSVRSGTRTSVDRKRQSLNLLHQHGTRSPHRQPSPGRSSVGTASPLKAAKPRLSALFDGQFPTPITSPLLFTGDFSPALEHGHRRQSSVASSDAATKPPLSPRLTSVTPGVSKPGPPSIKDFEIIKPISKGAFGSVYLSRKKTTGDYYAIKVLKKADMIAKNQVTNVRAERAIMMVQGESDFVAKLFWTFASKEYLYLVMEYLNGGDCAALIKALGGLPEEWAKKYMAEVILGIEHLHDRGIVHRDLKPDNLLIDQKGHLKLTDFGLSRMGLLGRQKRALQGSSESTPDLLKQGPFVRPKSQASSRSTSFDFNPGQSSPSNTPVISPESASQISGPSSYFSLTRESTLSREPTLSRESTLSREATLSRENSLREKGKSTLGRSDSVASEGLVSMVSGFTLNDPASLSMAAVRRAFYPIDDDAQSTSSASSDVSNIHPSSLQSSFTQAPPTSSHSMMPPQLALFDPEDSNRKFVGTPDYLAPETINGTGQDEMSDWWSVGCILFEFLYGYPPFMADTHEKVFDNILNRRIDWPDDEDCPVSPEVKDLMNKLMCIDQEKRLGARGADEIKNHPWFDGIKWDQILNDVASFIPAPKDIEDTEYFDTRGASLTEFSEDIEDHMSPSTTPGGGGGTDYSDRPHDAVPRGRRDQSVGKRNLMPLHIPPHVRESNGRGRRLSEPLADNDFGSFQFKNLPVLDKANKDLIQKLRTEALKSQAQTPTSAAISSPPQSSEGSPVLGKSVGRTLSTSSRNGKRAVSPSNLHSSVVSPPSRSSQPSSPLLVSFSAHQPHRKTSNASTTSTSSFALNAGVDIPKISTKIEGPSPITDSANASPTRLHNISPIRIQAPSKIFGKSPQAPLSPRKEHGLSTQNRSGFTRVRSLTVGSQDGEPPAFVDSLKHYKRHSQVFDMSPSSSDNEDSRSSALLRVQRRRQSSQRLSTISTQDGPVARPLDILVCEDHPVSRMVMERMLEKLQCRTMSVETGPEAVRCAMSEVKFDLILTEYKLPQINGDDLARMIKTTKNANSHTPIVAVTGYLRDLKDPHHFDDLIEKPASPPRLTEVMERLCSWIPPTTPTSRNSPMVFPIDKNRPPLPSLPLKGLELERRPSLDRTFSTPLPRSSSLLSSKSPADPSKAHVSDKMPKKSHSDETVPRVQNRMDTLTPPPSSLGEEWMMQKSLELSQKSTERARSQLSVTSLASPPPTPPRPPIPSKSEDRGKGIKSAVSVSSPLGQPDFMTAPEIKKPVPAPAMEVKMPIPTSIAKPISLEKPERPIESQVKIVTRQPTSPASVSSSKPTEAPKKVEASKKVESPAKVSSATSQPVSAAAKSSQPVTPVKSAPPVTPTKPAAPVTPSKPTAVSGPASASVKTPEVSKPAPKPILLPSSPVELTSNLKKTPSGSSSSSSRASTSPKQTRFQSPTRLSSSATSSETPKGGDLARIVVHGKSAPEAPMRRTSATQMPPPPLPPIPSTPKTPTVPTPKTPIVSTPKTPTAPVPKTPTVSAPKTPAVPTPKTPTASAPKVPALTEPTTPKATSKTPEMTTPKANPNAPEPSPPKAKPDPKTQEPLAKSSKAAPEVSAPNMPKITEPVTPKSAKPASKPETPATVKPAKVELGRKSPSPETVSKPRSFRSLLTSKAPDTIDSADDEMSSDPSSKKSLKTPKTQVVKEKRSRTFLGGDSRKHRSEDSK